MVTYTDDCITASRIQQIELTIVEIAEKFYWW